MDLLRIRKFHAIVEEIRHEGGADAARPLRVAAVSAVVKNPYVGRFEPDLMPFMAALDPLAREMAGRLIAVLGGDARAMEAFGKGAIVGEAGELEHGAAWHNPGGGALRALIPGAEAMVPATKRMGPMGARLDVPLGHVQVANVRSHYNAIGVVVADAPKADEIVFIQAAATGGRVHARLGGVAAPARKG